MQEFFLNNEKLEMTRKNFTGRAPDAHIQSSAREIFSCPFVFFRCENNPKYRLTHSEFSDFF